MIERRSRPIMSRLVVCALLLTLALTSVTAEGDVGELQPRNDVNDCDSKDGDEVLSFMQVTDGGHKMGQAWVDVAYPPENEPEDYVVNCIRIKDLKPELGATATITQGTAGSTKIGINLKSSFTKGFSFSIQLLGQKNA